MKNIFSKIFFLMATILIFAGCISLPAKKIPKIEEAALRSKIKTMFIPSVYINFKMFSDKNGVGTEVTGDNVESEKEIFANYIDKTHMVRRIEDQKAADFVLDVQLRSDVSRQNQYWLMASAFTLTLVPYWGRTYLTGKLELKDRGGKLLKSFQAKDEYRFIINFFVFPALPFYWSKEKEQEIRNNIYRHMIADLVKEGLQVSSGQ